MIRGPAILLVKGYRFFWHPVLEGLEAAGVVLNRCRLEPTCSTYALTALRENSFIAAAKLILARLRACEAAKRDEKGRGSI